MNFERRGAPQTKELQRASKSHATALGVASGAPSFTVLLK